MSFSYANLPMQPCNRHMGVNTQVYWAEGDPEILKTMIARAGFGFVRDQFAWSGLEKTKGGLNISDEIMDMFYKRFHAAGLGIIDGLQYGNPRYSDPIGVDYRSWPRLEETSYLNGYLNFVKYKTTRLKGYVNELTVWNEPNSGHIDQRGSNATSYGKLMIEASKAAKKADPNVHIVGGVVSELNGFKWLREMFETGAGDYMDSLDVHAYTVRGAPEEMNFVEDAQTVKALAAEYGVDRVISTESGYRTGLADYTVTPEMQGAYAARVCLLNQAYSLFDEIAYFTFSDRGTNPMNVEHNYGITRYWYDKETPYGAKPAYLAFANVNKMIGNTSPVDVLKYEHGVYAASFERTDGKQVIAAWSSDNAYHSFGLDFGAESGELYDIYGNSLGTLNAVNGSVSLSVGALPVYLIGNFTRLSEAKAEIAPDKTYAEGILNDELDFSISLPDDESYSLEVVTGDRLLLLKKDESAADGKISFSLGTPDESFDTQRADVTLKRAGKTVFTAVYEIACREFPVEAAAESKIYHENNPNRWQTLLTLKSMSNKKEISGSCRLSSPEKFAEFAGEAQPFRLKPGESRTVAFNLPDMPIKRLTKLYFEITMDDGASKTVSEELEFTTGKFTEAPPEIDGKIADGEWNGSWMMNDDKDNVWLGGQHSSAYKGADDLSYKFNILWDYDNFYMCVLVRDNKQWNRQTEASIWNGDSIQFAFEDVIRKGASGNAIPYTEIGAALTPGGSQLYCWSSLSGEAARLLTGEGKSAEVCVVRDGVNTVYELKIPWNEILTPSQGLDDKVPLGFSMLVNDDDGTGRKYYMEYHSGIGQYKLPEQYGSLQLIK